MRRTHTPERSPEEQTKLGRFKQLTEELLPAKAKTESWPIRFDHCFKRICLDHAFTDVWYRHLEKPAEKHIQGEALSRALQCAEDLHAGDVFILRERDAASLRVRGKYPKQGKGGPGTIGS